MCSDIRKEFPVELEPFWGWSRWRRLFTQSVTQFRFAAAGCHDRQHIPFGNARSSARHDQLAAASNRGDHTVVRKTDLVETLANQRTAGFDGQIDDMCAGQVQACLLQRVLFFCLGRHRATVGLHNCGTMNHADGQTAAAREHGQSPQIPLTETTHYVGERLVRRRRDHLEGTNVTNVLNLPIVLFVGALQIAEGDDAVQVARVIDDA